MDKRDYHVHPGLWHLHSPFTPDPKLDIPLPFQYLIADRALTLIHIQEGKKQLLSWQEISDFIECGIQRELRCLRYIFKGDPYHEGIIYVDVPKYQNRMAEDIWHDAPDDVASGEGHTLIEMLVREDLREGDSLEYVRIQFVHIKQYLRKDIN